MTDKEKLEKIKALADKMYSRMAHLTSDTRSIRQAMDEYHQYIINEYHKEKPVSQQNLSNVESIGKNWKAACKQGEQKPVKWTPSLGQLDALTYAISDLSMDVKVYKEQKDTEMLKILTSLKEEMESLLTKKGEKV